jgi:hypothetical protein
LIEELQRLQRELSEGRVLRESGEALAPARDESEYLFKVLDIVSQYGDSIVIDPLDAFIGTGNRVIDAVARFGEPAVTRVVAQAEGPDVTPALLTLRRMIDRPVRAPCRVSPMH